jgi:Alpha-L-fucosidase/Alpha-L-fucosidase C-terminal domain
MACSFQTETTIADWHYRAGQRYMDAKKIVGLLMQNVCRNGTMLLNLTQHGRGDLDPQVIRTAKDIGAWLKVNGEAVYASRPFEVCEENANAICYTRNNANVYAALMNWTNGPITLKALRAGGATLGKISKVEMLGSEVPLAFVQDDQGLTVTPGGVWSCSFTGSSVSVLAPKEPGAGKIEIQIDGQTSAMADESATDARQAQQTVCELTGLTQGKHTIVIINRGPGPVAVDALVVR